MRVSNKTIESNSRQPTCTTITIINNSSLKKQLIRTYTTCIKQTQCKCICHVQFKQHSIKTNHRKLPVQPITWHTTNEPQKSQFTP
eukprot:gene2915-1897_t